MRVGNRGGPGIGAGKEGALQDSYGGPEANRSGAGLPATGAAGSLRRVCLFAIGLAFH